MSAFSNYLELKIAQWVTGSQLPTPPSSVYIGLFNGDPGEAGTTGTEVTTTLIGNATRPAIPLTAATDGSGVTTLKNGSNFVFVAQADAGATVTHFAIFDVATGTTNLLFKGEVNGGAAKVVTATDEVRFNANNFVITID